MWNRLDDLLVRKLWDVDISSLTKFRAFIVKLLRLFYIAIAEFSEGQLTLRAMSLVYTTLLSLIPLLAVSFSVLKAFGVHNQIEPILYNFLLPLGPEGEEITRTIIEFVENIKVGVLGSIGLIILLYTVISMIHKIEEAFNYIWTIKRTRSFVRRFSDYMSIILIGPVLIFSAIGLTASIMSTTYVQKIIAIEPFGTAFYFAGKSLPYIFVSSAFTLIYILIPNIKVRLSSALVGGLFAGIVWQTTGWVFASFIVSSTKYTAIYSGFAILIFFIIWLYISWLILLVGAKVSFYHQYPQFLSVTKKKLLFSNRLKEKLVFLIMFLIGYNYHNNKAPWTLDTLVHRLELPVEAVQGILITLKNRGLLAETCEEPPAYLPARDIENITLKDLLNSVRITKEETSATVKEFLSMAVVDRVTERIENAIQDSLGEETLKDLVISDNN